MRQDAEGTLGNDLLEGADEKASFMFGDRGKRRKVYHLAETGALPVFRLSATLCARKSVLLGHIEEQERRAVRKGA